MAPRTESWVRDYTRVIARFHGVTYLCIIYVSDEIHIPKHEFSSGFSHSVRISASMSEYKDIKQFS